MGVGDPEWTPPGFCIECSAPFPWLDRGGRIYLLENLLDRDGVDEATRLEVREELEALAKAGVDEDEQVRRWARMRALAPGLWESGQRILVGVVTAEAKRQLGLPPN